VLLLVSCELQVSHGEQCGVVRVVVGGRTFYVALPDGGRGWSSVQYCNEREGLRGARCEINEEWWIGEVVC